MAVVRDFVSLMKPRLSGLVLFTTAGGIWLSGHPAPWHTWLCAMLGTAGTVGAANAFNCVLERQSDRFMARTANRPLPAHRMETAPALTFAVVLTVVSLPVLWLGTNTLTGALGALALFSYVAVYTPLKARTHWAMEVGALPGALPPLMGWTAGSGHLEAGGLALFAILYCWQLPHFLAIAMFRKAEYRAAGLTSLPLAHGDDVARWTAVATLVALLFASALPVVVGLSGWLYLGVALALGLMFLVEGLSGALRKGGDAWARRLFGVSLMYLTVLFVALGLDLVLRT
jgi:heme o synthase